MIHLAALRGMIGLGGCDLDEVHEVFMSKIERAALAELVLAEAAIQAAERVQGRRDDVVTITKPETFGPMIEALDNLNDALVALRAGGRHTP